MEMAELSRSLQLTGKSQPENILSASSDSPKKQCRPWLQPLPPATSNVILHIPTNALSQKTLHSLMQGKNVTQTESVLQKPGKPIVNKKQHIPPRGLVKSKDDVNESVRSKMRESLASALALVRQDDELSPKGKDKSGTEETPVMSGTASELSNGVESSVHKESEIPDDIGMEDANHNHSDGFKSQFDEVFPRDDIPFTDIIFSNDDLLQGNELSWVLDDVSDLDETKDYGKSYLDPEFLASKIEMELFKLFGGVNKKYREKGRSLLFNLKDKNNPELRERVITEEISAERLCSMTAEELASKELSQWRQAKAEKMAEMVVLRDADIDVRRLVRKTHKGEFQVEIDPVDSSTVDVSARTMSHSKRRPKAKSHSDKTAIEDKTTATADEAAADGAPPSTEEIDSMQGLALMDDELKDVEFLPSIVSLDEFMESLDSEPPFESPEGDSEIQVSASDKSDLDVGPLSKSPKEPSDKDSPKPNPEKIEKVSPKPGDNVKLDNNVSTLEQTPSLADVKGEKAWHGMLQLSMSSIVPVTGIFKSGEKAEMSEWPAMVEVKGRVRLSGFEKFIKELPKSRTRALMVMFLACKEGISKSQRDSLLEVVESYVAAQRVGYAEPASGVELYLCPTRGETLDLLTKVISKDHLDEVKSLDIGFIGVVVWRRAAPVNKPGSKRLLHSSSSGCRAENKKQRVNVVVTEKPSMRNHYHHDAEVEDDMPPGFGPVASRDDDDLPEFNFSSSVRPVQPKSSDQVRKLIHMYGKSTHDDDDDDIPEWQPNIVSHQLPQPPPTLPPGFRPEMGLQDHRRTMVRPSQDGWWNNNQNGGSGQQHYDRDRSRNRGF